jgi:hypothetical protein
MQKIRLKLNQTTWAHYSCALNESNLSRCMEHLEKKAAIPP